jgi:hypothetical protein
MGAFNFPLRWPMYVVLTVIAAVGLWFGSGFRARKAGEQLELQDVVFRGPEVLTILYGAISIARTVWIWIDPAGSFAVRVLEDPPGNAILAAYCNGLALAWVSAYVLLQYLRRHAIA